MAGVECSGRVQLRGVIVATMLGLLLSGCASTQFPALRTIVPHAAHALAPEVTVAEIEPVTGAPAGINGMIARYAGEYHVPEALIRRIIVRESGYNPRARNGPYWGLMQIRYDTAQSMGYHGPASGLLDADTNLKYGVKYLSGAYMVGGKNSDQAVRNYAHGYYYSAKRQGLLEEVGLR